MRRLAAIASAAAILALACTTVVVAAEPLSGEVKADGSSTVYLITEAMAVNFTKLHPEVNITVGNSGTGGGFKKFIAGEIDVADASRAISSKEKAECTKHNIEYLELQVAWDGLAVVIHPENTWAREMTIEQLKTIWNPESPARTWSDVDPSWPDKEIKLFGPGPDSGTFDYFTEAVNGKAKASRKDYQATENDNVIVKGVMGQRYALGYFGLAYFEQNADKLQAVAVAKKPGGSFVLPSQKTVLKGTYPLSRPLYIYVRKSSLERPEVEEFIRFYLRRSDVVESALYVRLTPRQQFVQREKFENMVRTLR